MKKLLIIFVYVALWSCGESKEDKAKSELRVLYCNVEITKKSVEKYPKSLDILKRNTDALNAFNEKAKFYEKELSKESYQKIYLEVTSDKSCK